MTTEPAYLTTREVARRARVDPSTVRRWADNGDLAVVKTPGGQYRFDSSAVDERFPLRDERAS